MAFNFRWSSYRKPSKALCRCQHIGERAELHLIGGALPTCVGLRTLETPAGLRFLAFAILMVSRIIESMVQSS